MKLITSPTALQSELKRLMRRYDKFHWATAWAGVSSKPFTDLVAAKKKIQRIVVGTHFYQTHPDFIEAFMSHKGVRFIAQPEGTFHPKLYVFTDDDGRWEMLVGSGNFTNGAFTSNTEVTVLVSDTDPNATPTLKAALVVIDGAWAKANRFTEQLLKDYRKTWVNQRPKLQSLSGTYGRRSPSGQKTSSPPKPIHEVPVAMMTWETFIANVQKDSHHGLPQRLQVLDMVREWFDGAEHFTELPREQRQFVAGLPNTLNSDKLDGGWFGSMRGAGRFWRRINANDPGISRALDEIPRFGELTKTHYDGFVHFFCKTFPGQLLAPATRLLAMKRPDTFVCLDSKNRKALCGAFAIPQDVDYERYWNDIVLRIRDSDWWLHPDPSGPSEEKVSQARAAFLDALYDQP